MATFFITKYFPSSNIIVAEIDPASIRVWEDGSRNFRRHKDDWTFFQIGRDAFETEADALADAEKRKAKKIASLEKQLAKVRNAKVVIND